MTGKDWVGAESSGTERAGCGVVAKFSGAGGKKRGVVHVNGKAADM